MSIKINLKEAAAFAVGVIILFSLCLGMMWQVTP